MAAPHPFGTRFLCTLALGWLATLALAQDAPSPGDEIRITEVSEVDSAYAVRDQLVGHTGTVVGGVHGWEDQWWAMTVRMNSGPLSGREEPLYRVRIEPVAATAAPETATPAPAPAPATAGLVAGTPVRITTIGEADAQYLDRGSLEGNTARLLTDAQSAGDWWAGSVQMASGPRTGEQIAFTEFRIEATPEPEPAAAAAAPGAPEIVRITEINAVDAFFVDRDEYVGHSAELLAFERNWEAGWQKVRLKMLSGPHAGQERGFYKIRYQAADRPVPSVAQLAQEPPRAGDTVVIEAIFGGGDGAEPDNYYAARDQLIGFQGVIEEVQLEFPDGWVAARIRMQNGPQTEAVIPFYKVKYARAAVPASRAAANERPLGGKNTLRR